MGKCMLKMLNEASGQKQTLYLAHGAHATMVGTASASKLTAHRRQETVLLVVDCVKFNLTH